ncbi:MAG: hypothetical protein AVDCRST_MAG21-552 [uncultured Nocardioidaceae bacterium]|uniref:Tryptophan-associated membrane protein n=1 Tax=uncultured Nocardioidaceae bacterium TaxID=253824 RepID=A0A6J4MY28_9ACTN|nr:MAG: hypothetical protein AVDCRST_MAG21-552 [uncultured Nocardioidaceae bacterium]
MAETRPAPRTDPGRRALTVLTLLGLAGGLLAVFAASRPWSSVNASAAGMPASEVSVSGSSALPWVAALALVVCASWLGVLATSGTARRIIALLSLLAALGVLGGALTGGMAVREAVEEAVDASPTAARDSADVLAASAARTAWPWLTALGGLVAAGAAAPVAWRGHLLPALGRRYRSPVSPSAETAKPVAAEPGDWWQALDEGRDPTR